MRRLLPTTLLSLLAFAHLGAQEPASVITEGLILGHVLALSDDSLGGRGPGSHGEEIAQRYLIRDMESAGLEPGGVGGSWLQPFDLIRITSAMPESLRVRGDGGALDLAYGTDWVAAAGRQATSTAIADAEIVFVGYGIVAPEEEWDDYKGADVAGKILLFLNNDPAGDRFAGVTEQEGARLGDLAGLHVAPERRAIAVDVKDV